jgi:uncharacterized protein (TIGR02996 family)
VLAFLQAIKEEPEDDIPRLVLADWLEEHGEPRGELLRLQVKLSHVIPGSAAGLACQERERQLRWRFERDWLGPLADLADSWTCHRGLMQLTLKTATFLSEDFARLARTEVLAWVDGVRLTATFEAVVALAESPLLAGLNVLNLGGQTIDPEPMRVLAASEHLRNLTVLELYDTRSGDEGARALAASPHLARLRHLNLDGCGIGEQGARALLQSPHLARLDTLLVRSERLRGLDQTDLQPRPGLNVVL